MELVVADSFLYRLVRKTPWYVSPVRVPCQRCAVHDPPYPPSAKCKYWKRLDFTCADHDGTIPVFKKHNEASSIQLFYDLFFVANLSICTTNHPVKDSVSLSTYIGFFTLLWFTWFSTIIFDVRFAVDSWFTRLSKACSFGVMAAFAMSTVYFDVEKAEQFGHNAQMISLILMASRLFLAIQYFITMIAVYYRYRDESVIKPFASSVCTSLASASIFLGLHFFTFKEHTYGYVGWYVTSVAEAAALLAISYYFNDIMKFDGSNLVERMGALTLIILGEGIIGMTDKVSFILKTSSKISASSAGLVISAVLVIYVLWMLYFDHTDMLDRPGSRINKTRPLGQLWAFFHFPLHTAILVTVEGSARFISWWNAKEALDFLYSNFDMDWNYPPIAQNGTQLGKDVRLQLKNITGAYPYLVETVNNTDFQANLTKIENLGTFVGLPTSTYNKTFGNLSDLLYYMNDALYVQICDLFDIEIPEAQKGSDIKIGPICEAYTDWFIAFFVAAGCVLIFLALARYIGQQGTSSRSGPVLEPGHRDKERQIPWVAITMQCLIGIGLALVSLLALPKYSIDGNSWSNFISSPWVIPTVLLAFSSVIICDNFLWYWSSQAGSGITFYSDILHPPRSEGTPEDEELEKYKEETKRLQRIVKDLGADPTVGSLLKRTNGRSKVSERSKGFHGNSKSPLLKSPLSPPEYELDRMSTRTKQPSVMEMPLLNSTLTPNERDSDAISARTEYSRLTGDPEEGYET